MKAAVLTTPSPISESPLQISDIPTPEPKPGHVLLRVLACGVCRTDLHIVEGEIAQRCPRIIPGHQIVGEIVGGDRVGRTLLSDNSGTVPINTRVGVSWIGGTDGTCAYCRRGE